MNDLVERLVEAWGDVVTQDASFDGIPSDWGTRRAAYHTNLRDRADGRYLPIYENEIDLRAIRQAAWLMLAQVPAAESIRRGLINYTISTGFDWQIAHPSPAAQELANRVLESFVECSSWDTVLERESFAVEFSDGEFLAEIVVDGPDVSLEPLEGDNLTEPLAASELEDWLGVSHVPLSWSFGIATKKNRSRPLFYHIIRNEAGTDFDCLPSDRLVHWKRNVPYRAKRGVSDLFLPQRYLSRADKVVSNTALGAAIQAAIAYVVEHAPGASRSAAEDSIALLRNTVVKHDPVTGEQGVRTKKIVPGQRIDIPAGAKYHASLLGSNSSQIYISVMEALLRLCATIYHFPEHMVTGFAGNNNMASSLVAESPFVQGRLADQAVRAARLKELFRKVLKAFFNSAWALRRGYDWEAIEPGLEITVSPPSIVTRDPVALTQALILQHDKGWVSARTAANELNRDYDAEQEQLAEERAAAAGGGVPLGPDGQPVPGALSSLSRLQFKRNTAGIDDARRRYVSGEITRTQAAILLKGLGLPPDDVETLLNDADEESLGVPGRNALERTIAALESKRRERWSAY